MSSSCTDEEAPTAAYRTPPADEASTPVNQNPLVALRAVAARNAFRLVPSAGASPVYVPANALDAVTAPAADTVTIRFAVLAVRAAPTAAL